MVTQGAILTLSSYATRTSPVLRGKWVLDNLLGTPPPPPPPNIPALEESNLGVNTSLRKRLEQHRANPSCAVCHDQMDAIGFALENYDATGAWRTKDGNFEIDSSGKLPGGIEFNGPARAETGAEKAITIVRTQPDGKADDLRAGERSGNPGQANFRDNNKGAGCR